MWLGNQYFYISTGIIKFTSSSEATTSIGKMFLTHYVIEIRDGECQKRQ